MHATTRLAWDEAAEQYERWLPEAIELIRGPAAATCSRSRRTCWATCPDWCHRAIHLQCAGGRDTLSLWNLGAESVVGVDYSPRLLDLARRLTEATGAPATWVEADVLGCRTTWMGRRTWSTRAAARCSGSRTSTGGRPRSWRGCSKPGGRFVLFEGHPVEWLFDVDEDGYWVATDYDYFAGPEASRGWAPEYIDRRCPSPTSGRRSSSPDRGSWARSSPRCWAPTCAWSGSRSTRWTGAGSHLDARPEERGRIPLSYSIVGQRPG